MEREPRDADHDLPKLLRFSERVTAEVSVLQGSVPLDSSSRGFGLCFMAACFVSREVDHLQAVTKLVQLGLHSEALILARSMLEGMVQLLWAAQRPDERPSRWHKFVFVEDWRLTRRRDPPLSPREEEERALLEDRVGLEGGAFLTRKAQRAIEAGQPLPPDPYQPSWHGGMKIKALFEETAAMDLWPLYRTASESIHWTMRGLGSSIARRGTKLIYESEDPKKAATALASGIQALLQTSQVLSSCLGQSARQSVESLRADYVRLMGTA